MGICEYVWFIDHECFEPFKTSKRCKIVGKTAFIDSTDPLVEPGIPSKRLFSAIPATDLENIASPDRFCP
jgi:hypothetical protein